MSELETKLARGKALAKKLFAGGEAKASGLPAKMREYTFAHVFGDVWQGDEMPLQERSLITCATLVALNRVAEQRLHFVAARNLGIPREKMEGLITHIAHYAGWPCAASAFDVLNDVWPE